MQRVWHRYEKWEDYKYGMWRSTETSEKESLIARVLELMNNTEKFKAAMKRVIFEWPISSEHNLSNQNANRQAWIGQAACSIELFSPEDVTRHCWGLLDTKTQDKANKVADQVIGEWETRYEGKDYQIHFYMGVEGLSRWVARRGRR